MSKKSEALENYEREPKTDRDTLLSNGVGAYCKSYGKKFSYSCWGNSSKVDQKCIDIKILKAYIRKAPSVPLW